MTTRRAATAIAALLMTPIVVALPVSGALAQGRGGPLEACRADVDKLCAAAEKAPGWRGKCLRDNTDKLSDGCKSAMAAMREQRQKVRAACAADIDTLCKPGTDGKDGERPMRCLKTNEAKLSPSCKTAMAAFTGGEAEVEPPAAAAPAAPATKQ
jgi:hypothetical protein